MVPLKAEELGPDRVVDLGHGLFRLHRTRFGTAHLALGTGKLVFRTDPGVLQLPLRFLQPRSEPDQSVFGARARCLGIVDASFRLPKPFDSGLGQRPGAGLSLCRPLLKFSDDARHLGDEIER